MKAGNVMGGGPGLGLFSLVLALHGLLLAWVLKIAPSPPDELARPFSMRMIAAEPVAAPRPPEPPKPLRPNAVAHVAAPPRLQAAQAAPVLAAAPPAPAAPSAFVVPAQPTASPPAPAAPAPLVAARFDAETLHNPKPSYPPVSRRLGEEGRVVLKVQIRADGQAETVDIGESSGYPRLDQAAREAVLRWRFVPARRGDTPVASSLRVPMLFRLEEG